MSPGLYVEFSLANVHKDGPKYDHLQYLSLLKFPDFPILWEPCLLN